VKPSSVACLCAALFACESKPAPTPAPITPAASLLSPAIRRLNSLEMDAAASAVLGTSVSISSTLPPDARQADFWRNQADFSRNVAQTFDSLSARQLYDATRAATANLDLGHDPFPRCAATAAATDTACQKQLVTALALVAFRRPPSNDELARLLTVFAAGAENGSFRDGAALVARALLGSPQFLYETNLGDGTASAGRIQLSQNELASSLSFLISGAPPDAELLAAAAANQLSSPDERKAQAVRLLGKPDSTTLFQRFVQEWLGAVRLPGLAKDASVTSDFAPLSRAMQVETRAFVDDVFRTQGGSLQALFAGGYSLVPDALAPLYGIAPPGIGNRVALRAVSRIGLLQQGSFLSVFAHEAESAPVLRGKAIWTRFLCQDIQPPQELGIDIVPPAPDPKATTRQRFERHVSDKRCVTCHSVLDPIGFTFENFDAIGRVRTVESEQPIDTSGSMLLDGAEVTFKDSLALSDALAQSEDLRNCAARQVLRFAAGSPDADAEDAFVTEVAALPLEWRGSLLGLFLEFVRSDLFTSRKAP